MSRTKRCSRCGATKPRHEFYQDSHAADGLQRWCRLCHIEHAHAWRKANPERERETARIRHRKRRADPEIGAIMRMQWRDAKRRKHGVKPENYRVEATPAPEGHVPTAPIREAVERAGFQYAALSGMLGYEESTVGKMLKRESVQAATAVRILDVIGVAPVEVGI